MGEVDHHLGAGQPLDGIVPVDGRDQLQVVRRLDGLAHFDTDAPAGAENTYPDHAPKGIPSASPEPSGPGDPDGPGASRTGAACRDGTVRRTRTG
ncbi:hypothetical protein Pve01_59260 [Planomonospora venezuelensis]|nr:hypothetical protein Pve01_59260 [Planomonospora venezuelensis]